MSTYESNRYSFPASAITAGTFDNARLSSGSVTQHVDLSNLSASNLTSGTIPNDRYGTPTFNGSNLTNTSVASSVGTWNPGANFNSHSWLQAKYVKVGRVCNASLRFQSTGFSGFPTGNARGSIFYISGLPFTSWNGGNPIGGGVVSMANNTKSLTAWVGANTNRIYFKTEGPGFNWGATDNAGTQDGTFYTRMLSYYISYQSNTSWRYSHVSVTYITAS